MADEKKVAPAKAKTKKAVAKKAATRKTVTRKATPEKAVTAKKVTAAKKEATKKAPAAPTRPTAPPPKPVPELQAASPPSESLGMGKPTAVSPEQRTAMIQEAAYYKAEKRNFAPGFECEDWDEAEREVDARLKIG